MSAPGIRAQYVATLRAIADAVEADESIPLPHGYLTCFPDSRAVGLALMRAVPLPWKSDVATNFLDLTADLGDYSSNGLRLYVHIRREHAGTEGAERTVTVSEFIPDPEITALLEQDGGDA